MTMCHMQHILLTRSLLALLLAGCSPKIEHTASSDGVPVEGANSLSETMLSALVAPDQQKMFGPFPCWKTHEGPYRYQSFMMRYLLNDETRACDMSKSWIGALYRDASSPNRYWFRFTVRQRLSAYEKWQVVDKGEVQFVLNGNEIRTIECGEMSRQPTAIDISVRVDAESCRYLQIRISVLGCHDDFHTFIKP